MGIALSLPTGFWLVQHNIHIVAQELSNDTGLIVYFYLDLPQEDVYAAADDLQRIPMVEGVEVVTAMQALEYIQVSSGFAEELKALDSNPLQASVTVTVAPDTTREQVLDLAEQLEKRLVIESVEVDTDWMIQLRQIQQIASRLTWILGALFGVGVVFVSVAAVRYAMDSRFDELRVIALLGASNRSMRRPFVYCGFLYGFGGGVVAMCIVVLALFAIEQPLQRLASSYGGSIESVAMNYLFSGALVLIGSTLGLIGALHVTLAQMRKNRYLSSTG